MTTLDLNEKNYGLWNIYRKLCYKKENKDSKQCQELFKKLFIK